MNIALLQLNYKVGDFRGNARRILEATKKAAETGADLCVVSELAVWGYPPRDLLLNPSNVKLAQTTLEELADMTRALPPILLGTALPAPASAGKPLVNAAVLLQGGKVHATFAKTLLPTYDVFDEDRYFTPAPVDTSGVFECSGHRIGVTICEDIWNDAEFGQGPSYAEDPLARVIQESPDIVVNLSASPFSVNKHAARMSMLRSLATKYRLPMLYVNQVGANDDLIFDGRSVGFNSDGKLDTDAAGRPTPEAPSTESDVWQALVLGVRDYAKKTGFAKALLGLSGGIDSALTAAVAAEALGPENVLGVLMPSPYSSAGSIDDSLELAKLLDIETLTLPITTLMGAFDEVLAKPFANTQPDTTEENIQSRIRGNLLMALSNKHRSLLLTTGNKSELTVGYCTIYGDMSGGLAVIADVPKTMVFALCRWLNQNHGPRIPQAIVDKPPSAELRPDQIDEDSLPPYPVLDAILERYVEQHQSKEAIVDAGFAPHTVERIIRLVHIAEFKRYQAAPGLKITDRAFGTGWRMPIAAADPEPSVLDE